MASAWKLGLVNFGKPIHGAAANAAKSMGFPNPKPFVSNKYSRYPLTAPQMIGNLRQIPGAATAITPTIRTVTNPIQTSNWLPLTNLRATGPRLRQMAATAAPPCNARLRMELGDKVAK
jgi:hypothetical protein